MRQVGESGGREDMPLWLALAALMSAANRGRPTHSPTLMRAWTSRRDGNCSTTHTTHILMAEFSLRRPSRLELGPNPGTFWPGLWRLAYVVLKFRELEAPVFPRPAHDQRTFRYPLQKQRTARLPELRGVGLNVVWVEGQKMHMIVTSATCDSSDCRTLRLKDAC